MLLPGQQISDDDLNILIAFALRQTHPSMTDSLYHNLHHLGLLRPLPSWRRTKARVKDLTGVDPEWYDCCVKACVCFVGKYTELQECPYCKQARY